MKKFAISAYELTKHFPDEASAILYLEQKRWNGRPFCPGCGCVENQYKQKKNRESTAEVQNVR